MEERCCHCNDEVDSIEDLIPVINGITFEDYWICKNCLDEEFSEYIKIEE